ncbi:MAG: YraN family protein [Armatimonadota bacterium]|nr:YraN family protein [Armatimonadota bacterium]
MPTAKSILGQKAESIASERLRRMGYRQVENNFRCRYGEIDIIAWDGDCLVFVEVRGRASAEYGTPAESVAKKKQSHLFLAAQTYLSEKQLNDTDCRFDVVEVVFAAGSSPSVQVIKGAFDAQDA